MIFGREMMAGVVGKTDLGLEVLIHRQPILRAGLSMIVPMAHEHLGAQVLRFACPWVLGIENLDRDSRIREVVLDAVDPVVRPGRVRTCDQMVMSVIPVRIHLSQLFMAYILTTLELTGGA